jgi:hypothetical protein
MRSGSGRIGVGVDDGLPHFCVELALLGGAAALVVETTRRIYDKPSAWAAFDQRMLPPFSCAIAPCIHPRAPSGRRWSGSSSNMCHPRLDVAANQTARAAARRFAGRKVSKRRGRKSDLGHRQKQIRTSMSMSIEQMIQRSAAASASPRRLRRVWQFFQEFACAP